MGKGWTLSMARKAHARHKQEYKLNVELNPEIVQQAFNKVWAELEEGDAPASTSEPQ